MTIMRSEKPSDGWKWDREGFYFNDGYGKVSGAMDHIGFPKSLTFDMTSGPKTLDRLYALILRLTAEFPMYEMRLSLSDDEGKLVRELSDRGLIEWEDMQHPYTREARLLRILDRPESSKNG